MSCTPSPSFISKTLVKLQQALTRTSSLEAVTALGRVLQLVDKSRPLETGEDSPVSLGLGAATLREDKCGKIWGI